MDGQIFYGQFPAVQIPIAEVKIVMHLWKAYDFTSVWTIKYQQLVYG